jgi:hypothetical protein
MYVLSSPLRGEIRVPLTEPYLPVEVTDVQMAFPADALERMPEWDAIPVSWRSEHTWQHRLWDDVFAFGLQSVSLLPVEGIDPEKAWRHIQSLVGSYAPKHEHKMASCAFLTSLWFLGARWLPNRSPHTSVEPTWKEGGEPIPTHHPDEMEGTDA